MEIMDKVFTKLLILVCIWDTKVFFISSNETGLSSLSVQYIGTGTIEGMQTRVAITLNTF